MYFSLSQDLDLQTTLKSMKHILDRIDAFDAQSSEFSHLFNKVGQGLSQDFLDLKNGTGRLIGQIFMY